MKKVIVLLFLFSLAARSQTVHVIFVADEEDAEFGVASISDQDDILRMFTSVKNHLGYKLKTAYFNKSNFTSLKVREALKKLKTRRRDIVVFYYSGKGYYPRNSTSSFPYLKLKGFKSNPLSLDEVARIVDSKREAIGLIIADCRDEKSPFPATPASFSVNEDDEFVDKLVTEKLFLSNCGVIKLASSRKGQPTYTNKRGTASVYTNGLASTYFNLMSFTTLNMVDNLSLLALLASSNNMAGVRGQTVNLEYLPCKETRRRIIKKFPPYANVLMFGELSQRLKRLVRVKSNTSRKAIIRELSRNFSNEAMVTVKKLQKINGENAVSVKTFKIADYWQSLETFDSKVVSRNIKRGSLKRSSDFTKVTSMIVEETLR